MKHIIEEATTSDAFNDIFEQINSYYDSQRALAVEIVNAKEFYFGETGKISELDRDFSNRMNAFLLWFTFDWRCTENNKAPFELYKRHLRNLNLEREFNLLEKQDRHIHSIFENLKTKGGETIIRDIRTRIKYSIRDDQFLIGCLKGMYFETRLFLFNKKYHFSNYYIPHPLQVKRNIKRRVKQIRKSGDSMKSFMMKLHSYHTKWEKYRNIDIRSIYHFDKTIPEAK